MGIDQNNYNPNHIPFSPWSITLSISQLNQHGHDSQHIRRSQPPPPHRLTKPPRPSQELSMAILICCSQATPSLISFVTIVCCRCSCHCHLIYSLPLYLGFSTACFNLTGRLGLCLDLGSNESKQQMRGWVC